MAMTHITSELLNDRNLSLWLVTIALLAFSAGYGMASLRHSGAMQAMDVDSQLHVTDLAMGKYGHITHRP
jgi:hypothetical protein